MVFEQFLDRKTVSQHFTFVFFLSIVNVFISYFAAQIFFPGQSLAIVLFITLLLVPSLHHLIILEEKLERKGSDHFIHKHSQITLCYFGAFLGILVGYFILGPFVPGALSYQSAQLAESQLSPDIISGFAGSYTPSVMQAVALFTNNLWYLIVGFVLAIFYGAGSVVLIAYNASFFAAFILVLLDKLSFTPSVASLALLHLIPEMLGFILTAIAGATLSRALIVEKYSSKQFKNVVRNVFLILVIGILLVLAAAFIETYVTAPAFANFLR